MSETRKTVIFVVVALVVVGLAWLTRPADPGKEVGARRGQRLFPDFNDPLKATDLEILEYDQSTATVRPFQVAQVGGRWSIPSHSN